MRVVMLEQFDSYSIFTTLELNALLEGQVVVL
jgi:hypothetical protein